MDGSSQCRVKIAMRVHELRMVAVSVGVLVSELVCDACSLSVVACYWSSIRGMLRDVAYRAVCCAHVYHHDTKPACAFASGGFA